MRAPPTDTPPARAPHSRPGRVRPTLGPCQLTAELKATIRVLIVDDDRTLRESCASVLQYEGYQVSLCSRGDEARETLKRNKFDIVLLDLYMPEVSGLRLLRTCLEAHSDTIVLVITGNPSVDSSLDALRAGAWDYLPKPFSATHLQILVGRAAHTVTVARESLAVQAEFEREHGAAGRARGHVKADPGQATPRDPGRRGAARRERDHRRRGERAVHRVHQPQPGGGRQDRRAPGGPLLPPARGADPRAAAAGAPGRHSAARRILPEAILDPPPWRDRGRPAVERGGAAGAARAPLEGQRARARERRRTPGRPAGAG